MVVNRFRSATHFYYDVEKFLRHGECVIAANRDQCVTAMLLEVLGATLQAALTLAGIGARGAQDGAATGQNSADRRQVALHGLVFQQPAPALHEPHELVFLFEPPLPPHSPNHPIQPGTIAPVRQHYNLHRLILIGIFYYEYDSAP